VKTYREAIDKLGDGKEPGINGRWLKELTMFSSRGYTTGMFFGKQPDSDYNFDGQSYRMSHEMIGVVLDVDNETAKVGLRSRLDTGDSVEYLTPGLEGQLFEITSMKDREGIDITTARNEDVIFIKVPEGIRKNDLIRREIKARMHHPKIYV